MTPEVLAHIKRSEGFRLTAYLCPAGKWTIGYGRTQGVAKGDTTTREREERWFLDFVTQCSASALRLSPILSQEPPARLAAIESFIYNAGAGAYATSKLRKAVDARDWERAGAEMRRWNKAGGKVEPGLVTRREIEARWLETGQH